MFGIGVPEILILFIPIFILLLIFLLLREFWCWYLKQNKIVSLLEDIRDLLEDQTDLMPQEKQTIKATIADAIETEVTPIDPELSTQTLQKSRWDK